MLNYKEIPNIRANPNANSGIRFLSSEPFFASKNLAKEMKCDLAVPNGKGIGNVICFTRLVEICAKKLARRISILTAPIDPAAGTLDNEDMFPIWKNNPYIEKIKDCSTSSLDYILAINSEQDNCCQFNHFIENICYSYGFICNDLRASLHLSIKEMIWAFDKLSNLRRPLICLHMGGTSSPIEGTPWYLDNWKVLISKHKKRCGFFQVGKKDLDVKEIGIPHFETTIRQMMSLIWSADVFIGFDSSPAHIATAFQKPTAVLWNVLYKNDLEEPFQKGFGPSALTRWSYPQNRNLMMLGEKRNELIDLLGIFIKDNINQ